MVEKLQRSGLPHPRTQERQWRTAVLAEGSALTKSIPGRVIEGEIDREGRNLIDALKSMAIMDAIAERFPERTFANEAKDIHIGLKLIGPYTPAQRQKLYDQVLMPAGPEDLTALSDDQLAMRVMDAKGIAYFDENGVLTPAEKLIIEHDAENNPKYNPREFKDWSNNRIWAFLKDAYTNYFFRNGKPNRMAENLFNLIKMDVCGLILDYARIANIQETVLLENPDELFDPEKHGEDAYRCSAEVEMLERALSYRAQNRVLAARILDSFGITKKLPELTDLERDQLLRTIYMSKWPDEKPQMMSNIMCFIGGITASGKKVSERRAEQLK